jgi:hypothetical protein
MSKKPTAHQRKVLEYLRDHDGCLKESRVLVQRIWWELPATHEAPRVTRPTLLRLSSNRWVREASRQLTQSTYVVTDEGRAVLEETA